MRSTWFGLFLSGAAALAISSTTPGSESVHAGRLVEPQLSQELPQWLLGVWTRNWIQEEGKRSSTFDVHYLQTSEYFGDLRIPKDRSKFSRASSFADLSNQQLQSLARQLAFAGRTTIVGKKATWHHQIDFQPADEREDAGRLELIAPGHMYEHGLDGSYTESWRSTTDGNRRFLVIQTDNGVRTLRLLQVAGDYFLYVRNRDENLPRATSLDVLIASPGTTRAQVIKYLDCEFSFGRIRGGPIAWEIQRSTLPWREGRRLDFVDQLELKDGVIGLRLRATRLERLTVPLNTLTRSELALLFGG